MLLKVAVGYLRNKIKLSMYQKELIKKTKKFRPAPKYKPYPPYHTGNYIEDYFFNFYIKNNIKTNRIYLPISWTSVYINEGSENLRKELQEFLNSLDPNKKYFTVCQHEESPKEILPKNTIIFTASGKVHEKTNNNNCKPIPLICSKIQISNINKKKDIFCSFIGANTHIIRNKLYEQLKNDKDFYFEIFKWEPIISKEKEFKFKDITERSIFTLCPRGDGPTSFRFYEAMQLGSIPVYVYDSLWLPYQKDLDWHNLCVLVHENEIPHIKEILESISEEKIKSMQSYAKKIYDEWFSLEGMSTKIIMQLQNEKTRLLTAFSDSHDILFKKYFKPTVDKLNEYDLVVEKYNQLSDTGEFYKTGWKEAVGEKLKFLLKTINECWGDYFIFSDVDVMFIKPSKDFLINQLGTNDVAFQRDNKDLCSGFFIMKANDATLKFVTECINNYNLYPEDQEAMRKNKHLVNSKLLPNEIFNIAMVNNYRVWNGEYFDIPKNILVFHANWTVGIKSKIDLFDFIIENLGDSIDLSHVKNKHENIIYYKFDNNSLFVGTTKAGKMINGKYLKKDNEVSIIDKSNINFCVNIYFNYFKSNVKKRTNEIEYCLSRIIENKKINNIFLLCSDDYTEKLDKRIIKIDMFGQQPTYEDVFNIINFNTGINDLNIILNSDCFIDEENIKLILDNIKNKQVYCLSRWDINNFEPFKTKHFDVGVSQDAWIFLGKMENLKFKDFKMGKPGCDNRIAYEFDQAGYTVLNPSKDVKVYHYHFSNIRTYGDNTIEKEKNRIPKPYKFIESSSLKFNIPKNEIIKLPVVPENNIVNFNIINSDDFNILHHLGLIDHIINNGMVRYYCNFYKRLNLFCKEKNAKLVQYMYRDLNNINLITIKEDIELNNKIASIPKEKLLKIILNNSELSSKKTIDTLFYEGAKISLNYKWDNFFVSRDSKMEKNIFTKLLKLNKTDEYVFIQGDINKMNINPKFKVINVDNYPDINIFYFMYTIENAKEIHCENDIFYWLIDCMQLKTENLFLYAPINNMLGIPKLDWKIITPIKK